jgi:antibiotic biosynthesis monooxygenase (ABM) superfamily enzyme
VLTGLISAAEGFDGHLGANVFRTGSEYRVVFKFQHLSNLEAWEKSAIRGKLETLYGGSKCITLLYVEQSSACLIA